MTLPKLGRAVHLILQPSLRDSARNERLLRRGIYLIENPAIGKMGLVCLTPPAELVYRNQIELAEAIVIFRGNLLRTGPEIESGCQLLPRRAVKEAKVSFSQF